MEARYLGGGYSVGKYLQHRQHIVREGKDGLDVLFLFQIYIWAF